VTTTATTGVAATTAPGTDAATPTVALAMGQPGHTHHPLHGTLRHLVHHGHPHPGKGARR
jgi:hypothetical protein